MPTYRYLTSILGEDEVGVYSAYYHGQPSNRNQYASTLLIIWVSASPLAALQPKDTSLIDYAVAFWALHRLGAIST